MAGENLGKSPVGMVRDSFPFICFEGRRNCLNDLSGNKLRKCVSKMVFCSYQKSGDRMASGRAIPIMKLVKERLRFHVYGSPAKNAQQFGHKSI